MALNAARLIDERPVTACTAPERGWKGRLVSTVDTTSFYEDPLAPVSAQFPLTRPGLYAVNNSESPSTPDTRPFGLRRVRVMPEPVVSAYEYCHDQQVSVAVDGSGEPIVRRTPNMEWSTITDNDGDEGPSEDFGNDFAPDYPVQA